MNVDAFRAHLHDSLRSSGIADKLKSQLRSRLVTELKLKSRTNTLLSNMQQHQTEILFGGPGSATSAADGSLFFTLVDSLIIGYLKSRQFDFTLSVFMPESGLTQQSKILSSDDIATVLHLNKSSTFARQLMSAINVDDYAAKPQSSSFLFRLLTTIAITMDLPCLEKDTQTEILPEDLLEWKIRQSEKDSAQKFADQNRITAFAIEERMLRYQQEVDMRMKADLDSQLSKFKDIELAHLRVEERRRYNSEISKLNLEHERELTNLIEKLTVKEEVERSRLKEREKEMDHQNMELRSKLLDESKKTILAEMAAKTDAELVAKELKLEKDSLEKKYQEAMAQIFELNQMKERYSQKMHETMAQYKIDLNKQHSGLLSSVEIEKNRLESEKSLLSDKQRVAEQMLMQAKTMMDDMECLRAEVKTLKQSLSACEKERDLAKDNAKEFELKLNIQQSSSAVEFELQSMKRQLLNAEKAALARQEEYQGLLLQLVKNPASLVNSEQEAQLQQTQQELAKTKKSELHWQRECQTLVDKLDQEIDRNEVLQKKYDEAVLNVKELKREVNDLRMTLARANSADIAIDQIKRGYSGFGTSERSIIPDPLDPRLTDVYTNRFESSRSLTNMVGSCSPAQSFKDIGLASSSYSGDFYRQTASRMTSSIYEKDMQPIVIPDSNIDVPISLEKPSSSYNQDLPVQFSATLSSQNSYLSSPSHQISSLAVPPPATSVAFSAPSVNLFSNTYNKHTTAAPLASAVASDELEGPMLPKQPIPQQRPPVPDNNFERQTTIAAGKKDLYSGSVFDPIEVADDRSLTTGQELYVAQPSGIFTSRSTITITAATTTSSNKNDKIIENSVSVTPPSSLLADRSAAVFPPTEAVTTNTSSSSSPPPPIQKEQSRDLELERILEEQALEKRRAHEEFERVMREKEQLVRAERQRLEEERQRRMKQQQEDDDKIRREAEQKRVLEEQVALSEKKRIKEDEEAAIAAAAKQKQDKYKVLDDVANDPVMKKYMEMAQAKKQNESSYVVKGSSVMSTATATAAAIVNSNESMSVDADSKDGFDFGAGDTGEEVSAPDGDEDSEEPIW